MNNLLILLVRLVFSLYIYCIILDILFQLTHIERKSPIIRYIETITRPALKYIQKVMPSAVHSRAIYVLLILALCVKLFLISILYGFFPNIIGIFGWAALDLSQQLVKLYTYLLFMQLVFTSLMSSQPSPVSYLTYTLTYPILSKIKGFIPTIKSFDISPIVAIVILQLISHFLINPFISIIMQWSLL
jgi:YggT family protein